jgi:hypothetical protein
MNNQILFAVTNDLSSFTVPFLLAPLKSDTRKALSLAREREKETWHHIAIRQLLSRTIAIFAIVARLDGHGILGAIFILVFF